MLPKSNWVTQVQTKEVELWRGVFSFSRRGKKGNWGQARSPPNTRKGVDGGRTAMVGCVSFISPSSNSTRPRHPQPHPFWEPGGVWEERVYVCGKRWGCLLLKASRVEPLALSPLHPPLPRPSLPLLLSPGTKNVLNARRLLQCQITKGKVEGWREEREMTNRGKLGWIWIFIFWE